MLQDLAKAASKSYVVLPVPKDLIPSQGFANAQILWVGCSDSWITETSALDVLPEETFVHRNLGNVMSNGDLSSESAIAYCVDLLKVRREGGAREQRRGWGMEDVRGEWEGDRKGKGADEMR